MLKFTLRLQQSLYGSNIGTIFDYSFIVRIRKKGVALSVQNFYDSLHSIQSTTTTRYDTTRLFTLVERMRNGNKRLYRLRSTNTKGKEGR